MLLRRDITELADIEKTLNKGRGSFIVLGFVHYGNFESDVGTDEMNAYIANKWDVMKQYPEVIQWFKDNGLEPRSS